MKSFVISVLVALAAESIVAQVSPLPAEFHSAFSHSIADRMYLAPESSGDLVYVDMTFRNVSSKEVRLNWVYRSSGAMMNSEATIETVGYSPTSVCRRSGLGFKLYVAGWSERTGVCVIEEWEIATPIAVGAYVGPEGGDPVSVLDIPAVTKTLIFSSTTIGPIHDMVCSVFDDSLWLLEGQSPRNIQRLSISTSEITELYSSTALPSLADDASLGAGVNLQAGFLIWSQSKRRWESMFETMEPYPMAVFVDADKDGGVDAVVEVSAGEFASEYAAHGWDLRYPEPAP